MLDQVPLNFVVKSKSVEIILLAVLNKKRMLFIKKKTPAESCEKTKIKEHLSIVVVNIINQSFIVKKKKKNYKRLKNVQDKDQDCTVSNHYQLDLFIPTYFKN